MVVTKYNLKNSSKNKTSKIRRVRGGLGTSSFGEYAFGSAGMQTSVDGTSNLISTNPADKYMANPDTYAEKMVVDGVVGSKFLGTLKSYIENPILFLGANSI